VRCYHERGLCRAIAVNNSWELAPWADALYACDGRWWHHYKPAFAGQRWTQSGSASGFGARQVKGRDGVQLSLDRSFITYGNNSGFQALNLAIHFGCTKVIFIGLDCGATVGGSHWHGDHDEASPHGLKNPTDNSFQTWRRAFAHAAKSCEAWGVDLINASERTALTSIRRMPLAEALHDLDQSGHSPAGLYG
jgi:hypothetical protein